MGAVGGLGVVAEAVDSFRHLLRKYAIRRASMAFGPHRSGRAEKAGTPCHHPLVRRLRLAREHRLPAALDDQSRRRGARGAAIDAARVDVPIAGSVLGMPFAHQYDRRPAPHDEAIRTIPPWERPVASSVLKLWNESRTNRARIADSIPVGIRSRPHLVACPGRPTKSCKGKKSRSRPMLKWINGDARLWNWENCRRAASGWTPFAASGWRHLLRFCRRLARLRHRNELGRLHNPEPERGRNRDPIGHHQARARN